MRNVTDARALDYEKVHVAENDSTAVLPNSERDSPLQDLAVAVKCQQSPKNGVDHDGSAVLCRADSDAANPDRGCVLAILRAAYRIAYRERQRIQADLDLLVGIARAVEAYIYDPAYALDRAVEHDLVAWPGNRGCAMSNNLTNSHTQQHEELATVWQSEHEPGQIAPNAESQTANSHQDIHPWADPDWSLLDDRRGSLPEFPINVLGPNWRDWLQNAVRGAGVLPDHVFMPLLTVASTLVGASRPIRASRPWSEVMALWTCVVGFSGAGKTPGLNVTMRALSAVERARKGKIAELRRAHDLRAETAKAAAKKWKNDVADAVAEGRKGPEKPPEAVDPGEFIVPRLAVTDATIERLAVLLQARPSGLAAIYDELAGLFLNMERYSNGSDREFWLRAWNGQQHIVERQGRPAIELDHLLIGLTGGFQPDKLAASFKRDCDGMYARMLFAWPDEPSYRELANDVDEIEPEFQNALGRLVDLAKIEDGHLLKRSIDISAEAAAAFEQFRQFSHRGRRALDGREREWFAKGPGQVLRLAGTLCWLDWAMAGQVEEPRQIDAAYVNSAIELWRDYFLPHARAALRQIGFNDQHVYARRVLRWARAERRFTLSREEIRRDALSQHLDAEQTQRLIDSLVRAGWLREAGNQQIGPGRRARRWHVNSELWGEA